MARRGPAGAVEALQKHGSADLQARFLPKIVTGEWPATMNLTEPQAGSDVGALKTRATPRGDGTYLIQGVKIYITFGEHDLSDNIIHLVLARLPDHPSKRLDELMPWNWQTSRPASVLAQAA